MRLRLAMALVVVLVLGVTTVNAQSPATSFSGSADRCNVYLASPYLSTPVSIGVLCGTAKIKLGDEDTATHVLHFSVIETNGAFTSGSLFIEDILGNIVFVADNYTGTFTWNNLNSPAAVYTLVGSYSGVFADGSAFTGTMSATVLQKLVRFYRGGGSYVWYAPSVTGQFSGS